jgi:hypothetical protein
MYIKGLTQRTAIRCADKILYFLLNFRQHFVRHLYMTVIDFCVKKSIKTTDNKKLNSVALVIKRTIPTERPPLVGEVSANFCG